MQETRSAGNPGDITAAPASASFLDSKPELAAPKGSTSEETTSAGSDDLSHEFENSATKQGGGPGIAHMQEPVETINSVNRTDGPQERGPREEQAHANTVASTDADSKEDRSVAPHQQ